MVGLQYGSENTKEDFAAGALEAPEHLQTLESRIRRLLRRIRGLSDQQKEPAFSC
jgi:hypothetical protein